MNTRIQSIIQSLEEIMFGEPWYGRNFFDITRAIDPAIVAVHPGGNAHTLLELVYHCLTWTDFTLHRVLKDVEMDLHATEALDWRVIDPEKHTWASGLEQLQSSTKTLIAALHKKSDALLEETVDYRSYNFEYLLKGLVQHNIYHLGQIAAQAKILEGLPL